MQIIYFCAIFDEKMEIVAKSIWQDGKWILKLEVRAQVGSIGSEENLKFKFG